MTNLKQSSRRGRLTREMDRVSTVKRALSGHMVCSLCVRGLSTVAMSGFRRMVRSGQLSDRPASSFSAACCPHRGVRIRSVCALCSCDAFRSSSSSSKRCCSPRGQVVNSQQAKEMKIPRDGLTLCSIGIWPPARLFDTGYVPLRLSVREHGAQLEPEFNG